MSSKQLQLLLRAKLVHCPPKDRSVIQSTTHFIIDSNYKDAVRLANRELKRNPSFYFLQALRALALCRQGKSVEASTALNAILNAGPKSLGDVHLLKLITIVYHLLGMENEALNLMDKAVLTFPQSHAILLESFYYYSRYGVWKSLSSCSLRLFKFADAEVKNGRGYSKDNRQRYLWWSIYAHILHVQQSLSNSYKSGAAVSTIPVILAERLLKDPEVVKLLDSKPDSHHFFVVASLHYTKIMLNINGGHQQLDRFPFAEPDPLYEKLPRFGLVTKPGSQRLSNNEQTESIRQALFDHLNSEHALDLCSKDLGLELWKRHVELELGNQIEWLNSYNRCLGLISGQPVDTNWATISTLVRLAIKLKINDFGDFDVISKTKETLKSLSTEANVKNRGFKLGLIELEMYLQSMNLIDSTDHIIDLIEDYIESYSSQLWCWEDLEPFISNLSQSDRDSLSGFVSQKLEEEPQTNLQVRKIVDPLINYYKFHRALQTNESSKEIEKQGLDFVDKYYYHQGQIKNKDQDNFCVQSANEYALLAAQTFICAWSKSDNDSTILERAAIFLKLTLKRAPEQFQQRLVLTSILRLLGLPASSFLAFEKLGVKQIQIDTLSHYVFDRSSTLFIQNHTHDYYDIEHILDWYHSGESEATESTASLWVCESYSQIQDFRALSFRLQNSLSKAILFIEQFRVGKVTLGQSFQSLDIQGIVRTLKQFVDKNHDLVDNRDFKVIPNLAPMTGPPIMQLSSMGPRPGRNWVSQFSWNYITVLNPRDWDSSRIPTKSNELTNQEYSLLDFMYNLSGWLHEASDNKAESSETFRNRLLTYFEDETKNVVNQETSTVKSSWEIIHHVQQIIEAFVVLKLSVVYHLQQSSAAGESLFKTDKPRNECLKFVKNKLEKQTKASFTQLANFLKSIVDKEYQQSNIDKHVGKIISLGFAKDDIKSASDMAKIFSHDRKTSLEKLSESLQNYSTLT